MFESLKSFAAGLTSKAGHQRTFDETDYRYAAVALLVHVAEADGRFVDEERSRIRKLIAASFDFDEATAGAMIKQVERSEHGIGDFGELANALKRALDEDGRRKIVEMLWDVAYADGTVHEFEDNYIWRVAELLGVPQDDPNLTAGRPYTTSGS